MKTLKAKDIQAGDIMDGRIVVSAIQRADGVRVELYGGYGWFLQPDDLVDVTSPKFGDAVDVRNLRLGDLREMVQAEVDRRLRGRLARCGTRSRSGS